MSAHDSISACQQSADNVRRGWMHRHSHSQVAFLAAASARAARLLLIARYHAVGVTLRNRAQIRTEFFSFIRIACRPNLSAATIYSVGFAFLCAQPFCSHSDRRASLGAVHTP